MAPFALHDLDIGMILPIENKASSGATDLELCQVADHWESFAARFFHGVGVGGGLDVGSNDQRN